jgi:hypothetical protein
VLVISRSGVVGASDGAESDELLVVKWMTCRGGGVVCIYMRLCVTVFFNSQSRISLILMKRCDACIDWLRCDR